MSKTKRRRRRRNRKRKKDVVAAAAASSKDTIKTYDNSGVDVPWSNLNHDVLFLVMMRLGLVEFFAFSGVCKSWKSLAVSNKNKFIVSRPPMSVHVSRNGKNKEVCYFKDFEGRKFKPVIPRYASSRCIGVTSGYLILWSEKKNELRLVNLITRHELDFPNVPDSLFCCGGNVRALFVFSPSISEWVLVVLNFCYLRIWFSVVGKREWIHVRNVPYSDSSDLYCVLYTFKGKIYSMYYDSKLDQLRICEVRLYPNPELVSLETESIPSSHFKFPGFVSCGEKLYVIDHDSGHPYKNIHELDFGKMKLVSHEKIGREYAFFLDNWDWQHHSAGLPGMIIDLRSQYGRSVVTDKNENESFFYAKMWYFFHDCLNANLIHE